MELQQYKNISNKITNKPFVYSITGQSLETLNFCVGIPLDLRTKKKPTRRWFLAERMNDACLSSLSDSRNLLQSAHENLDLSSAAKKDDRFTLRNAFFSLLIV